MRNPVTGHEMPPVTIPKEDAPRPDEVVRREYADVMGALGLTYLERSYEGMEYHPFCASFPSTMPTIYNNDYSAFIQEIRSNAICDRIIVTAYVGSGIYGCVGLDDQPLTIWDPAWNYLVPAAWMIAQNTTTLNTQEIIERGRFHKVRGMP